MNKFLLIDLRAKEEYNNNHLENAINISMNELFNKDINYFKDINNIYIYCRSGNRSKAACDYLKNNKIKSVDLGSIENARRILLKNE